VVEVDELDAGGAERVDGALLLAVCVLDGDPD
jgi:hypothetical protein